MDRVGGRYYRKMEQSEEAQTLTYRTVRLASYMHFDVEVHKEQMEIQHSLKLEKREGEVKIEIGDCHIQVRMAKTMVISRFHV